MQQSEKKPKKDRKNWRSLGFFLLNERMMEQQIMGLKVKPAERKDLIPTSAHLVCTHLSLPEIKVKVLENE